MPLVFSSWVQCNSDLLTSYKKTCKHSYLRQIPPSNCSRIFYPMEEVHYATESPQVRYADFLSSRGVETGLIL